MPVQHQSPMDPRRSTRNGLQPEQPAPPARGSSDDVRKRMDDIYAEIELSWRNGQFHLPLKFVGFHKTDVMFLFVRAAIGYSLAFVKVKTLEKELLQLLQDRKHCIDTEAKERDEDDQQSQQEALGVAALKERIKRAMEAQQNCVQSMSAIYARLLLHCSNFENHKEDERFFECVYFFVCSVVKLGVAADYWRPIEEELGFLFRGAQFSANIKLHATTAYKDGQTANSSAEPQDASTSTSHSGTRSLLTGAGAGGGCTNNNNSGTNTSSSGGAGAKKTQSLPAAVTKDAAERLKSAAATSAFEVPKSRIAHFAPSVPVRHIVAELQATKNRAARNMELSQALRDRIRTERSEDRRRQLEAVMSPRHGMNVDALDADVSAATDSSTRSSNLLSPRISMKSTYTTRSPALNHLLPTTEARVKLALKGYEQGLQVHRNSLRLSSKSGAFSDDVPTQRSMSPGRELWRK
ncbi:hypothetical protein PHYPSEUDO_012740 [Phytophthora pseudosyringae]|uniref:Uncharacterized protein n=1 Tax=Phytophthora pseudosyringae TaxID=221518 RepID=A0A8T1V9M4_9STRA|nr:hypothetical protein PHYPSEUDO_012740 [Phytophthora pseudosyringae]